MASRVKRLRQADVSTCDTVLRSARGEALFAHSLVLALHSPVLHGALAACTSADAAAGTLAASRPPAFEVDLARARARAGSICAPLPRLLLHGDVRSGE